MESPEKRPRMRGTERRPWPRHFLAGAFVSFLLGIKQLSMCSAWLTAGTMAEPPVGHCPLLQVTPHESQHQATHSSLQGSHPL